MRAMTVKLKRRERIVDLWAAGFSTRAVAYAFQTTEACIKATISQERRRGNPLPRRTPWSHRSGGSLEAIDARLALLYQDLDGRALLARAEQKTEAA